MILVNPEIVSHQRERLESYVFYHLLLKKSHDSIPEYDDLKEDLKHNVSVSIIKIQTR